ncbi:LPS export ABC transporter protein LptC [Elusimicrobium posterum]|uniref:LPS export ABC transporter periplasmic protein LptC n=1 Tax=Elusimicrobium posterum TaxID=3116653 RepID=UPI003C73DD52
MKKYFLLTLSIFVFACGTGSNPAGSDEPGVQTVEDVVIYEALKGQHTWILEAKEAKFYENENNATITMPKLSFNEGEKSLSTIKGDKGSMDIEKKTIVLENNVQGNSTSQNAQLRTSLLNYNMETKKIWTDKNVTIVRNGVTVHGRGLKANGDLSEIEILRQTTTLPENEDDF